MDWISPIPIFCPRWIYRSIAVYATKLFGTALFRFLGETT